jgi:hypothetical protein
MKNDQKEHSQLSYQEVEETFMGLFLVNIIGEKLGWSLSVVHISQSFSTFLMTQRRFKNILILFITYILLS